MPNRVLDVLVLMKQHAQTNERLTTLEAMGEKEVAGAGRAPPPSPPPLPVSIMARMCLVCQIVRGLFKVDIFS